MSVQATTITRWKEGQRPEGFSSDYQWTEMTGDTTEAVLEKAEKVIDRLGDGLAVVWDNPPGPRRVRLCETSEEMSWLEFLQRYGVEVGILRANA